MTDSVKEQLSSYLDNELSPEELELFQKRLLVDDKLRARLEQYQLIRETMQRQLPECVAPDFSSSVMRQIESESVHHDSRPATRVNDWLKSLAGLGIAASVAVLSILVIQRANVPDTNLQANSAMQARFIQQFHQSTGMRWQVQQPGMDSKLNGYLVNHSEYTSESLQGTLRYSRIVGYDSSPKNKPLGNKPGRARKDIK